MPENNGPVGYLPFGRRANYSLFILSILYKNHCLNYPVRAIEPFVILLGSIAQDSLTPGFL